MRRALVLACVLIFAPPLFAQAWTGTSAGWTQVTPTVATSITCTVPLVCTPSPITGVGVLSFSGALPNGTTATTQAPGDNSTKVATTAFVLANGGAPAGVGTELQYRNAGVLGAVAGSSVSGGTVTLSDLAFGGTTTTGLHLKSLTTAQKNATTPAAGDMVYDSDLARAQIYDGAAWHSRVRLDGDTMTGNLTVPAVITPDVHTAAGVALSEAATAPTAAANAQAGVGVTIAASNAVDGSSGHAAQNGGNATIRVGTGVNSGAKGYVQFYDGSASTYLTWPGNGGLCLGTMTSCPQNYSVVIGSDSPASSASGSLSIVVVGRSAAPGLTSGRNGTYIGAFAGGGADETNGITAVNQTTGYENTFLGHGAGSGAAAATAFQLAVGPYARTTAANMVTFGGKTFTVFQLGSDSSDTQTARVLRAAGARAGTDSDTAGSPLYLAGGLSTGTAAAAPVKIQTGYPAASTANTAQTVTDRMFVPGQWTTLTESSATATATLTYGASTAISAEFLVTVRANDATDFQSLTTRVRVSSVRKATGNTVSAVNVVGTDLLAESAGGSTLTCTPTVTEGASAAVLNLNCVSSLTQTFLGATWQAQANGAGLTLTQN